MTQAQCKAARRKNRLRYRNTRVVSVSEAVERGKQMAARQQAVSKKKK